MRIAPVAEVKAHFSAFLQESEKGPIVVTRNGKPVAVLLHMEDEEEIERLIFSYSPTFQALLKAAKQSIQEGAGVAHDDFWQDISHHCSVPAKNEPPRTPRTPSFD